MPYGYITPYRSPSENPEEPQADSGQDRDTEFSAPLLDDANITIEENA
ncbi:hypothetical protein [Pontixanthobacter luteolus]|nr:hypothetical protein [Pontixanthobacter luteolus]